MTRGLQHSADSGAGSPLESWSPRLDGNPIASLLDLLRPLIERTAVAVVERLTAEQQSLGDKLAYSEPEAAALLSVQRHVLRDARLRGEIEGCRIGKGIRYERQELVAYLRRRRGL